MHNYPHPPMEHRHPPQMNADKETPLSIAMAYVPWQKMEQIYDPSKAFKYGTLFPELNLPFMGCKGGVR